MRRSILALLLASFTAAFCGCAAPQGDVDSEGDVAQSEDALALASLYGTWNDQGGAFYTITFTKEPASTFGGLKGRRFEATIDTGIRCITTPCPSQVDVSGVYKLTHGTQLTLAAYDKPSVELAKVLGAYGVKLKANALTLTKRSDRTIVQTFDKAVVHTAGEIFAAAEAHAWPARDPDFIYRTFTTRTAAETWGNTQSASAWLARDGETSTATKFVSGQNDLWSQEFTVNKTTLAVTITGEH